MSCHEEIRHPGPLQVGEEVALGPQAAEALRFRQVNVSEAFTLRDAEGRYFRASLKRLGPGGAEALVYEAMARAPESPLRLSLLCAVLARQRMFVVIQKATELGALRVAPALTARSVGPDGLAHEKAHAWPAVALRACKQCRRASVPEVPPAAPLEEVPESAAWRASPARFYLDDRAAGAAPLPAERPDAMWLAVGPEGGWTDAERERLQAAGATPLVIGGRVLRAETAVLVGLTLLQHQYGDIGLGGR